MSEEREGLTNLVGEEQIVAGHEPEENEIIEENSLHGCLEDDWAKLDQPRSQIYRVEDLPRHFTCSCGASKPLNGNL